MRQFLFILPALISFSFINCGNSKTSAMQDTISPDTTKNNPLGKPTDLPIQITFPSLDGLIITADSYFSNDSLPWILLCHQARYSRGEYKETAAKFAALGYNCLAIDQRSGEEVNGVKNETAARAKEQGKPTTYLDTEQDIIAALNYLYEQSQKPVILVGSSYSAGLVLKIAVGNAKVKAVLSFSPGEYYGDKLRLAESIRTLDKPVFITSSRVESKAAKEIYSAIGSKQKHFFAPASPGVHASSCLWESTDDYKEYWKAVNEFMGGIK